MTTTVVVGPGRAGTVIAAALERAGHEIVAAIGGGAGSRARFVERFPSARDAGPKAVPDADLVLIATPDDAVPVAVESLTRADLITAGQRVVHVSGALGLAPLRLATLAGARVAACHPAQTIPDASADPALIEGAAWAVTAAPEDLGWARELVRDAGGHPVDVADADRLLYHAALVVGSNTVGAAVSVARQLLLGARVADPAAFLRPLVRASVENVLEGGAAAITGPVRRGDLGTIRRHLEALDRDAPDLAGAYRSLLRVVLTQVRAALDPDVATELDAVIGGD